MWDGGREGVYMSGVGWRRHFAGVKATLILLSNVVYCCINFDSPSRGLATWMQSVSIQLVCMNE